MEQFQTIHNLGGLENEISTMELPFKQPWKQKKDNALPPEWEETCVHSSRKQSGDLISGPQRPILHVHSHRSGISHCSHCWGRNSRKQVIRKESVFLRNEQAASVSPGNLNHFSLSSDTLLHSKATTIGLVRTKGRNVKNTIYTVV